MVIPLSLEHLLIFASAFVFSPVLFVLSSFILVATLGDFLEIREKYVACLIRIFEWGSKQTSVATKSNKGVNGPDSAKNQKDIPPSHAGFSNGIIQRDNFMCEAEEDGSEQYVDCRGWAVVRDSIEFIKAGIEVIIEDEVTNRFQAERLTSWNLLTRNCLSFYSSINWKLTLFWIIGFFIRYFCLLPMRLISWAVGLIFLVICTAAIGVLPDGKLKRDLNEKCMLCCCRILSRSVSAVIYFHNPENKAKSGGICVANHTSPMDVIVLSTDNVYTLVGQKHTGFLGFTQRALSRAGPHIWFERNEANDRHQVRKILKEHVEDSDKLPILIFPEGTCINNTSVMMFKKGCFEIGSTVFPIAMKYDPRFGDPFWNSSEQGWCEHLSHLITSWAIICHVWYLPPMNKLPHESAIQFANRVKKEIAVCGGLIDLQWDGGLKRFKVPRKLVISQQKRYFRRMSRYISSSDVPLELSENLGPSENSGEKIHASFGTSKRLTDEASVNFPSIRTNSTDAENLHPFESPHQSYNDSTQDSSFDDSSKSSTSLQDSFPTKNDHDLSTDGPAIDIIKPSLNYRQPVTNSTVFDVSSPSFRNDSLISTGGKGDQYLLS
ncbi:hypothetical protein AB6A40_001703 [Gnathostoma spinigerum]|uniref:Phospholipid/glycerol acyltransferase domain-containing protein n=1 Tax=Gnathostoma spinigerum TaxID=75299 RepID=A0ABD6EA22_9BILA